MNLPTNLPITCIVSDMTDVTDEADDLTTYEFAAAVQVSQRTVVRWIRIGRLNAWRAGRDWRIPRAEEKRLKGAA